MGLVLLAIRSRSAAGPVANYAARWPAAPISRSARGGGGRRTTSAEGFVLWRGIGVDYEGGILDNEARIAIQLAHRLWRWWWSATCSRSPRACCATPACAAGAPARRLVLLQFGLGIANVLMSLPLHVAVPQRRRHRAAVRAGDLLARLRAPDA